MLCERKWLRRANLSSRVSPRTKVVAGYCCPIEDQVHRRIYYMDLQEGNESKMDCVHNGISADQQTIPRPREESHVQLAQSHRNNCLLDSQESRNVLKRLPSDGAVWGTFYPRDSPNTGPSDEFLKTRHLFQRWSSHYVSRGLCYTISVCLPLATVTR